MNFPPGLSHPPHYVCQLHQAPYRLKQGPRAWFEHFSRAIIGIVILIVFMRHVLLIIENFVLEPISVWLPNWNVLEDLEFWWNISKLCFGKIYKTTYMYENTLIGNEPQPNFTHIRNRALAKFYFNRNGKFHSNKK